MSWRPEGWREIFVEEGYDPLKPHTDSLACPHCTYEAGADAMLEALRKDCKECHCLHIGFWPVQKGHWRFIPDD